MTVTIKPEHLDAALEARRARQAALGTAESLKLPRYTQCCLLAQAVGGPSVVHGCTPNIIRLRNNRCLRTLPGHSNRKLNELVAAFDVLPIDPRPGQLEEAIERIRERLPFTFEMEETTP